MGKFHKVAMVAMLLALAACEAGERTTWTRHDVIESECATICVNVDSCGDLPATTPTVGACFNSCVATTCDAVEAQGDACDAAPIGTRQVLDACLAELQARQCGAIIGTPTCIGLIVDERGR